MPFVFQLCKLFSPQSYFRLKWECQQKYKWNVARNCIDYQLIRICLSKYEKCRGRDREREREREFIFIYSRSQASFYSITEQNSVLVHLTLVLCLSEDIPVCAAILEKLQQDMYGSGIVCHLQFVVYCLLFIVCCLCSTESSPTDHAPH